jgi:endo-1,4-beta-xylanase
VSPRVRRIVVLLPLAFVLLATIGAVIKAVHDRHGPSAKSLPGAPLKTLARARGITAFGTAVDDSALQKEPGYRTDLAREFSALTPENAMKWGAVEKKRGKLDWGGADRAVAFAEKHHMLVRGHTLVWHNQIPDWLLNGKFARAQLWSILHRHIASEMGRYKGRIAQWDVDNEVVGDDGRLRPSLWLDTLGPSYIAQAYRWARQADPHAKLYLNEIGAESAGPKSDKLYELARQLKSEGLLDGVGFQSHMNLNGVPPTMRKNLQRFADLGLDIAMTEVDVALQQPAGDAQLRVQADVYRNLANICLSISRCHTFIVWGFTDRHSWIPVSSPGYGSATLLDSQLRAKPAYDAVASALRSR